MKQHIAVRLHEAWKRASKPEIKPCVRGSTAFDNKVNARLRVSARIKKEAVNAEQWGFDSIRYTFSDDSMLIYCKVTDEYFL